MMMETTTQPNLSITAALGIRGWSHLDAILLASLATEFPLLLIGPHGTAKSFLVERMAGALGLPMRHYNAALLNYDDLVGIPMPDESQQKLHFITTPGTIWDAGFVFFDEISRCRPDLQNKLFPIIHERRVIGMDLYNLRHRWAAMNPPAPEDPANAALNGEYYLGSEPLDPALTDRFPFIITVPRWSDLSKEERRALVKGQTDDNLMLDLRQLVEATITRIAELEQQLSDWVSDYILCIMDLLEKIQLPQSPRRANMLARAIIAVHAARLTLEGDNADLTTSTELTLRYGLPQNATEVPPSQVKLIALHRQAWEITQYLEGEHWRQVMEEFDLARRVALADQLGFSDDDLSRLITQTLGAETSDPRQVGLAVAMFLAFSTRRNLLPSAFEPLAQLSYHILEPRVSSTNIQGNSPAGTAWNEIKTWIENQTDREHDPIFRLERNYALYGVSDWWERNNWKDCLKQFRQDLMLFEIEELSQ